MRIKHLLLASSLLATLLAGCGKDNKGGASSDSWYAESLYTSSYFSSMELWEESDYHIFESNGIFAPGKGKGGSYYDPETGLWEFSQQTDPIYCDFIHIVDSKQLHYYESAVLAKDGSEITQGRDKIYSLKTVKAAGNMSFYGYPTIYFYEKDGNMITITLGKETAKFMIEDSALLINGGGRWPKFDHNALH